MTSYSTNMFEQQRIESKKIKIKLGVILIGIFFGIVLINSSYIISAGERGVLLTFGKPSQIASAEGLHLKIPFIQKIVKMDVRTQKYVAQASAASKDLQIVSAEVAVNYRIMPERSPEIYQTLSLAYQDRIIQPAIQEGVKSISAGFTAEELITRRPEVKQLIEMFLRERLLERGMILEEVSITNFDFSETFNIAIEEKVTAQQQMLKAERDLERILIEKEQKIAMAQAEAESLRLQKQQISPELIKLRSIEAQMAAIDKWDGKLPQVTGGAIPFIDINGDFKDEA